MIIELVLRTFPLSLPKFAVPVMILIVHQDFSAHYFRLPVAILIHVLPPRSYTLWQDSQEQSS
jgi:hypothetical protein